MAVVPSATRSATAVQEQIRDGGSELPVNSELSSSRP